METFKRNPAIRMLAMEIKDTTVNLQSGDKESYQASITLSPTGADVNRVLMTGTVVEKEDVGSDTPFWRIRIADPTGAVFVYAGQYQPEAAKAIQSLEVPSFVIVCGKLSHYTPENGGDTIVSVRAESIVTVSLQMRDQALSDIATHTIRRIMDARTDKRVDTHYPKYDFGTLISSIKTMLDTIIAEQPAINAAPPAAPPAQETKPPEQAKPPEPKPEPKPVPEAQKSQEVKQAPKAPEPPKPEPAKDSKEPAKDQQKPVPDDKKSPPAEKAKKTKKKEDPKAKDEASKGDAPKVPDAKPPEPKAEPPKESPKPGEAKPVLQDSDALVLDILKTHKAQGALAKETISNVLRALGYALLDVDSILARLKTAGEIIEPTNGFFKAV
jgi:RPA family protein